MEDTQGVAQNPTLMVSLAGRGIRKAPHLSAVLLIDVEARSDYLERLTDDAPTLITTYEHSYQAVPLTRFNFSEFNRLRDTEEPANEFPSLARKDEIQVALPLLSSILLELNGGDQVLWDVIFDCRGAGADDYNAMLEGCALRVRRIALLIEGASDGTQGFRKAPNILARESAPKGYTFSHVEPSTDSYYSLIWLCKDGSELVSAAKELEVAKQKIAGHEADITAKQVAESKHPNLQESLTAVTGERDRLAADLAGRDQSLAQRDADITALREQIGQGEEALGAKAAELQTLQDEHANLQEALTALAAERDDLKGQIAQREEMLAQQEAEKVALVVEQEKASNKDHEIAVLQGKLEEVSNTLKTMTAEAGELRQSERLGKKMAAKAASDLAALREQYQERVADTENLRELVEQLRDRLRVASGLYEKLLQEEPEVLQRLQSDR